MNSVVGKQELNNFIINNKDSVIVLFFSAKWCEPCKKLKKQLENKEFMNKMPQLEIAYIDINDDMNEKLTKYYNVDSIPLQVFISLEKNDNEYQIVEKKRIIGYDIIQFSLIYEQIVNNQL